MACTLFTLPYSLLYSLWLSFSLQTHFFFSIAYPSFFFNPLVSSTGFDVCLLLSLCLDWCLTIRVFFLFWVLGFFFKIIYLVNLQFLVFSFCCNSLIRSWISLCSACYVCVCVSVWGSNSCF
jgi:hypothetical protein